MGRKRKVRPFPINAEDWLSSRAILSMSPTEEGAYIRLLCCAWLEPDGGLPDDDTALASLSRLGNLWSLYGKRIRSMFLSREGRLYNTRQMQDRETTADKEKKRKEKQQIKAAGKIAYGNQEVVLMTQEEYQKIVNKHGEYLAAASVQVLEQYLGPSVERRKKYTDHYRCILSWVIDNPKTKQIAQALKNQSTATPEINISAPVCLKCGKELISMVCGPCGIDYTPRRR